MTISELQAAFSAVSHAIQIPLDKKPKTILHATIGYRRGTGGKPRHIKEISKMTLEEVFNFVYAGK